MCDYEEPSEKPSEFEMEERLDDTEDSQLATSVESEGGEGWGEGDSQPGEVEALEPEMDDSQEWTEEAVQQESEEGAKEEWIEEQGGESEEPGLEIEEHLEEMEELVNETEDQTREMEEQGQEVQELGQEMEEHGQEAQELGQEMEEHGQEAQELGQEMEEHGPEAQELGQEMEEHGQEAQELGQEMEERRQEEIKLETEEPGDVKEEDYMKVEEHGRERMGENSYNEENIQEADLYDNGGQEEGTSAEQDSIYESLAGDREEALMQDDAPAAEAGAELKEECSEEPDEPAEEVEWLMEEALSDDDEGEQSQMEMEATLNSFERDPSDDRPSAGSTGRRDPAAGVEDDGDNNSTEDLLRLLGDESDKTQARPKSEPPAAAEDAANSEDEEEDDMSWKLNYINEAKEKMTHTASNVPTPNKIGNITLVPREAHASKLPAAAQVKTAATDVKKETAVKADGKVISVKMELKRAPAARRVNIPVRNNYFGAVIKKIDEKVVTNAKVNVKQSIKMEPTNKTKDANTSRSTDNGQAVNVRTVDRKRERENDEEVSQAKRIKKPVVINSSVTTRSRVQEQKASAGGAVAAERVQAKQENSHEKTKGNGEIVRVDSVEGEVEEHASSDSDDDGSLDDYLDSSDASSGDLRQMMERTVGRAEGGERSERLASALASSGDDDTDDMFDSLSSSSDEEKRAEFDFTLDLRGERASEFLPLLGRDAAGLLALQKRRLATTLRSLQKERTAVRARLRASVAEARRLRSRLSELEAQVIDA